MKLSRSLPARARRRRRRTGALAAATAVVAGLLAVPLSVPLATPAAAAGPACTITALSLGANHVLALGSGTVYAWGYNAFGQLGDGTTTLQRRPRQVPGLSGITGVAAAWSRSFAIGAGGTVWAWGANTEGQLGDGTTVNRSTPVQLPGLSGITALAGGVTHTLAIGPGGTVYAWGWNGYGQLGDGTSTSRYSPVQVPGLTGVTAIAAGDMFSVALTASGAVYTWGDNEYGQLGDNGPNSRHTPGQVPGLTGVTAISAGGKHTLALRTGGGVHAWGSNTFGELGDGTTLERRTPIQVPGVTATAVAAGSWHSLALTTTGTLRGWGDNASGQLGDGTTTTRLSPVTVSGASAVSIVAAGQGFSGALSSGSGTEWIWGENGTGQVGDGTFTDRTVPTALEICYRAPVVTAVTDAPDPVIAGSEIDFTVNWTDENGGDQGRVLICKTNSVTSSGCPGGAWATSDFLTSPGTAYARYNTTTADAGTRTYWAFACDTTNLCSSGVTGTFTVNARPTSSSVSDSPDPVTAGSTITFSVGWSDPNAGQQVRALVCKTIVVNSGTCGGGTWATGALTSTSPAFASYTTTAADGGNRAYWAFACDSTNLCSSGISGTFTVQAPPTASAVTDTPDPVAASEPVTFSLSWADPNAGQQVRAVICRTNAVSAGTCPGGSWAIGNLSTANPATASYVTSGVDGGTRSYWAFACDSTNLCSAGVAGTFTVDMLPSASCDSGTRLVDQTVGGVRTRLALLVTGQTAAVCVKTGDVGGRATVTAALPTADYGTPTRDTNWTACAATTDPPNQVPGSHPLVGNSVSGVPYLVDVYRNSTEIWFCVRAGDLVGERIVVPYAPTVSPGTQVSYEPDPA